MPSSLTYPGVYVEEIPSGVRTITGVPTSVTAFVGRARKGPDNEAVDITSFADFERVFGGLWAASPMTYAVRDFYLNGGSRAVIVRVMHPNYTSPDIRGQAEAAAAKIVAAAVTQANGKDAKKEAEKALKGITDDAASKPYEIAAAQAALESLKTLADDAKPDAIAAVARTAGAATVRKIAIGATTPLIFEARHPGRWGADLRVTLTRPYNAKGEATEPAKNAAKALGSSVGVDDLFTLTVVDEGASGSSEVFANVTLVKTARRVDKVLENESSLIVWAGGDLDTAPQLSAIIPDPTAGQTNYDPRRGDEVVTKQLELQAARAANPDPTSYRPQQQALEDAIKNVRASLTDGGNLGATDLLPSGGQLNKHGLYALEQLFTRGGLFNLLCIPPYRDGDVELGVLAEAVTLCEQRRAMLIVDPPLAWKTVPVAADNFGANTENLPRTRNAAVYFPRLRQPNPLRGDQIEEFAPCGVVAGIYARTDVQRGVWKSPAGLDASLVGVSALSVPMTDEENGRLNPLGVNCLRTFPVFGRVVWGARTLRGADDFADEYKYVPVRRCALFIEESLHRGLKWVVFEPNDEPLWAQIRLNVGAFMHNLFRQGAFQGASPREAYFVKCDQETTTQNHVNLGIVNIVVGFAPLKPAEFVVIKLQQIVGQIEV